MIFHYFKITILIVCCFLSELVLSDGEIILQTKNGKIRGLIEKSRLGNDFYSFRGIKYAEAPVDNLRFEPPQEIKPWGNDIYDATKNGKMCPQEWNHSADKKDLFSEDCLILNVYTKNLNDKKPVMVFIHGGAFRSGGSNSDYFSGPNYLMDKDIVLVTFNYRLGLLGFITTGTKEAPGNLAFKDQVLALKWVQKNIEKFGGNPNLVTVFGQSAGSNSISLHLVSPMSQGLFHRAIMMSGTSTTRIPALNRNQTQIIAYNVGCSSLNPSELINCLRKVSYQKIIESYYLLNEFGNNPIRKWNWVVEDDFGQERFLVDDANVLMKQGKFMNIPMMVGITSKEFLEFGHEIANNEKLLEEFNDNFEVVAPICFLYERDTPKSRQVSLRLREKYFNNEPVTKQKLEELGLLFSDGILKSGLTRMVDRIRKHHNVYLYSNGYKGRYSFLYNEINKPYGMIHGDDLLYLFTNLRPVQMINKEDLENLMVERMTSIWTDFAAKGSPNVEEWIPSNATEIYFHELSDDKSERTHLRFMSLWNELFPEDE